MKVTMLAGGVGGARFALGLRYFLRRNSTYFRDEDLTIIVNTGDDAWIAGLRLCPDLDSIMYALTGLNDQNRGWGRAGDTERVSAELHKWNIGWPWFTLGDLDLATLIARSSLLRDGKTLTEATDQLSRRWPLGARLLPATDSEVPTQVIVEGASGHERLYFQEWWVRERASRPALRFELPGVEKSLPAPGVLKAIREADVVILGPSNPVVSIGTILAVPGIADGVRKTRAPVVGVSPIIAGRVVRGMADACLAAIGVDSTAQAVAEHYGARSNGGLLDAWLVDSSDKATVAPLHRRGIETQARPLWFTSDVETGAIAADAIELALAHR